MKKTKSLALTVALGSVAAILAACGGGGGSSSSGGTTTPSLQLSGTAATGAALAGADVQVKCAGGTGTATTSSAGGYTVTISGGTLPCLIKVSGTANGVAVSLHSLADSGTAAANGNTNATANVTPVTEMIVAQLVAAMPADAFANFNTQQVTATAVASAASAIVEALKAAGVDMNGIDPLKATLVPANGSTAGNAYDQLLDVLGDKVGPESLPLVVNQIAAAAVTNSSDGLGTAMAAVSGGSLAGCPVAVSGKYRTLEYFGRTAVREINFKDMTFQLRTGGTVPMTADPANPCTFTATGPADGQTTEWTVAFGPSGVGSFRARYTAPSVTPGAVGYIFPEQAHPLSAVAGTWSFVQSGFDAADGMVHWPGQLTLKSDNSVAICDYDSAWNCVDDGSTGMGMTARTDGGFDLNAPGQAGVGRLYAYRAPGGALAVFGTTNPDGLTTAEQQTVLVATKLERGVLPEQGSVSKYWDTSFTRVASPSGPVTTTTAPTADATTVKSVDAATGSVTRKRESDGREDVVRYNTPLEGVRTRAAGSWNSQSYIGVYMLPLTGMGVTTIVNSDPAGTHFYGVTPRRQ